ncbi:hypothetical protein KR018_001360 [Drosophila ironensis]|nr:hypothetical protein KR018_001360 [Drosophila ironensis]
MSQPGEHSNHTGPDERDWQLGAQYCELSGRTMPTVGEVSLALINMGLPITGLDLYMRREAHTPIPLPPQQTQQRQLSLLQAGTKASHPPYVPSYLPAMPDPHAYIRTPTHKQPVTEYEAIREKAACQKRDIEKALCKFLCKTSETNNLFPTEDNMFPLIACKPSFPPYMAALNPTDQVFDFEELEYHYLVANRTEDAPSKEDGEEGDSENEDLEGDKSKDDKHELEIKPNSSTNKAILDNPNIDNPYLRAATLPKRAKFIPVSSGFCQYCDHLVTNELCPVNELKVENTKRQAKIEDEAAQLEKPWQHKAVTTAIHQNDENAEAAAAAAAD